MLHTLKLLAVRSRPFLIGLSLQRHNKTLFDVKGAKAFTGRATKKKMPKSIPNTTVSCGLRLRPKSFRWYTPRGTYPKGKGYTTFTQVVIFLLELETVYNGR